MPYVYNGIGTWYWGKSNVQQRGGTCEFCGKDGTLRSYDTTLFFVVLFIPLIPLRRVHIIDDCSRCSRHRVLGQDEWQKASSGALSKTGQSQREHPNDPDAAASAISAAIAFQDAEALSQAAELVNSHLPDHAETNALLGFAFAHFAQLELAADAFRASLAAKDDPAISQALAGVLIKQKLPDEALPWIEHLFDERIAWKASLCYDVVLEYQSEGRHQEALAVLERCTEAFPVLAGQRFHKSLLRRSTKHQLTGKKFRSHITTPTSFSQGSSSRWKRRAAALVAPVLVLLALVIYLCVAASIGRGREIHVVNGTSLMYNVDLNGNRLVLLPMMQREIELPEGEVTIHVRGAAIDIPDERVTISTSFLTRPFNDTTFVINPDHAALLMVTEGYYGPRASSHPDRFTFHTGEALYQLEDVDFVFTSFPSSLPASKGKNGVTKRRLSQITSYSPSETIDLIDDELPPDRAAAYAKAAARFGSTDPQVWDRLERALSHEEMLEFLKPGLAVRPHLVDWHRAYQDTMLRHEPTFDLKAQYQRNLDESPLDGASIYLRARTLDDDPGKQEMEYLRALDSGLNCPHPAHWLTYATFSTGRFEQALAMSRRLTSFDPKNHHYYTHVVEALLALGRLDEALDENAAMIDRTPHNGWLVCERMILFKLKGDEDQVAKVASDFVEKVSREDDPVVGEHWREAFDAHLKYQNGDSRGFGEYMCKSRWESGRFRGFLAMDDLVQARATLFADKEAGPIEGMVFAVAALHAKNEALAQEGVEFAVAKYRERGGNQPARIIQWLLDTSTPDAAKICEEPMRTYEKIPLLMLMGMKHAAIRDQCFGLARKLDCLRDFPHLLFKAVLEAPPREELNPSSVN